jgi:hypothetical protein
MFEYLFNTTLAVSPAELIGTFAFGAFVALACVAIILGTKWMRASREVPTAPLAVVEPMKVVPPWPDVVDDGPGLKPGPGHRRRLELESAPLAPESLPKYPSLVRFKDWDLDDPDRTSAWPVLRGVDAMDLDVDLPEPQQLPGFEVERTARKRFEVRDPALAEAAKLLPRKPRKAKAAVDLDAGTVVLSQ